MKVFVDLLMDLTLNSRLQVRRGIIEAIMQWRVQFQIGTYPVEVKAAWPEFEG